MRAAAGRARRRWLAVLGVAVLLLHVGLAGHVLPSRLGDGAAAEAQIRRIDVAFTQVLQPTAPPAAPAPPARRAAPRAAVTTGGPASAASAASAPVALAAAASAAVVAAKTEPVVAAVSPAASAAPAIAVASAAGAALDDAAALPMGSAADGGASAPVGAFEWPPSTRLSYILTGNYRGPVDGQAQVEWLRSGSRYQVVMDASIGPPFAPLMTRRASSEGEITADGLHPLRYEEETRVVLRSPRRVAITLDADRVLLANGNVVPRPAGVQDSASQFVHLTWLFTTQPQRLVRGQSIELPLALPRRIDPWMYDVLETLQLQTPAGPVEAVHVKPRREARPGDLTAEMWVAPSLQYLPVRILVRQDAETFIDLLIERLPQQAAQPR